VTPTGIAPILSPTRGGVFGAVAAAVAKATAGRSGGVLGATARSTSRGGVLGALAAKGNGGKLPFTGFPLWLVALIGAGLMALGLGMRTRARETI